MRERRSGALTGARLALEAATNTPTQQARLTRVLFAEIERILARLWTLGLSRGRQGIQPFGARA